MAKKLGKPKTLEIFVKTTEDWHPNYPMDTVRVKVQDCTNIMSAKQKLLHGGSCVLLICAWGADDFGMERWEYFSSHKDKNSAYKQWCREIKSWRVITEAFLKQRGFVRA